MEASGTRRVILIGKTGVGKSSLANTILGTNEFKTDDSPNSETKACQTKTKSVNGRSITLTDTPGFFDTDSPEDELRQEILRCIIECAPGPHAFLVVLKVEKYTKHEKEVIKQLCEHFSEEALKHAVIVFTLGEQLPNRMTIQEYVKRNEGLSDLVKKCGGRCHVVDNKYWKNNQEDEYRSNQFQVAELLNTTDKLTEANNGGYYTNEVLDTVESAIQTEAECITESPGNMSQEEIREKAKSNVFYKLLIKVTGTAVGTLWGAFLGIAGMVAVVIVCLKEGFIPPQYFNSVLATSTLAGATIGGAFGGYKGFQAAEKANTPKEAAGKALQDVQDAARNVVSTIQEKVRSQIKESGIRQ